MASAQNQLYVRDRPTCAVKAFAGHFGNDPKQIKGVGVKGDDQDLAEAVKKDINGLSFNNLGFIYDLKTRRVVKGLAVIPLDLNENGMIDPSEQVYGSLDNVILFVEKSRNPKFINGPVNFLFDKKSKNTSAAIFLNWVLTKGQRFNHDFGFLNLDDKFLTEQKTILKANFSVTSTPSCDGLEKISRERRTKNTNQ